jgi:asparagine synthase (glutamine-hydrolysing)
MCGIGGFWTTKTDPSAWEVAARLGAALRHRGPDDAGWLLGWLQPHRVQAVRKLAVARDEGLPPDLILAHRRLSIVDLAGGWQPLSNETGTVWIVYNGEIYNHLELRRELEALGHRFATYADTEMVVHAYEAWGTDAFARFNGIFAFALWDSARTRLLLARDPLGVKPVYYGRGERALWFASEVKAALEAGLHTAALHVPALELYLTYRFVPSPDTLFSGVQRVPPGHWVVADSRTHTWSEPRRFAPFPPPQDERVGLLEWAERLAEATRRAVNGQLMSDVPVGALLSGGLDSSVVVTLMRDVQSAAVPTYAVGFADPVETELAIARRASAALGTEHHEVAVDERTFFAEWVETISQLDEPVASPGHTLVGLLCRRVSQDLKVVLTGQGADEPLGGYRRHAVERWLHVLGRRPVAALLRLAARAAHRNEPLHRLASVAGEPNLERRFVTAFTVFTPEHRRSLLRAHIRREVPPEAALLPVQRWLAGTEGLDPVNRLLYVDARLSLADDLLLGSDKVSMASGVEARVPYLDLGYLAVAERIPARFKISWHSGRKQLQQLVGRRILPPALARPLAGRGSGWRKKRGFDVPLRRWFGKRLTQELVPFLTGPGAGLPEYLDRVALRDLLDQHTAGRADHTRRLSALLTLEAWHRSFVGGDVAPLRRLDASTGVVRV